MFIQKEYLSNTVIRLILALILALMIAGCSATKKDEANVTNMETQQANSPTEAEQAKTWTFTDTSGKEITLEIPVQKAVVINRNTAEAIKLLGAAESIAATGDNTIKHNSYLGFDHLPNVGETEQVNLEAILSLKPQVVFTYTNRPDHKLEEKLEPAGIKVVRMNNYLPEQMDTEWELLGKLFGQEERAAEFLEWKHEIERIAAERIQSIDPGEKKSVLALSAGFLNSNGGYRVFPSQSQGGGTGVGEGYATILAGGRDAADLQWDPAEASTTIMVDEEYVLKRNPDVVTLHGTWLGGYETMETKAIDEAFANMLNISSLNKLNAGKDREVYFFHTNFIGSDKRYIGVLQLAKWLYPDRFEDVAPDAYAKEYFEKWLGVPYQGIWSYSFKETE
ncbi:ABC transporter substrate-binding protein [Paenibacillus ihbetae]|uniref:ABC transporter substrate-binding protein n=1 Tax=Paenibacillus ihbetae TaxID=1870820 RepID=A0ABX3JZB4_9BACL|nr:ABC transporter substrate-binding protein [Paenibacillus ihbetae]OOC62578.1 ABC transporter substrate-binding protein [Paenibacillus ihbetae]